VDKLRLLWSVSVSNIDGGSWISSAFFGLVWLHFISIADEGSWISSAFFGLV
jgi:hypothetical protein